MTTPRAARGRKDVRVLATDAQIEAAIARARDHDTRSSRVVKASYRPRGDKVLLLLSTGVEVAIPRAMLQGLENATPQKLRQIEIEGPGTGLHWPALGIDHYIPAILGGVFGTRQWMSALGKKGGSARSPAKAAASRRNGRQGGRPRKRPTRQLR